MLCVFIVVFFVFFFFMTKILRIFHVFRVFFIVLKILKATNMNKEQTKRTNIHEKWIHRQKHNKKLTKISDNPLDLKMVNISLN